MKFVRGRANLSATVYVPWDCANNCPFCSSKKEYKGTVNRDKIIKELTAIRNSSIQEVVFTGGEPSVNPVEFYNMICWLGPTKRVFVNTTLPYQTANMFINYINMTNNVYGVNISRHGKSQLEDGLTGAASDDMIEYIFKDVHINVVAPKIEDLQAIIDRWAKVAAKREPFKTIVCIREDYTKMTQEHLHNMDDSYINTLSKIDGLEYAYHTSCNVCDTVVFSPVDSKYPSNFSVHVHRGVERTALRFGNVIEVNDIVLFPDGTLCYDWAKDCVVTKDLRDAFGINRKSLYDLWRPTPYVSRPIPDCNTHSLCGSSGCGGRTFEDSLCGGINDRC